MHAVQDSAPGTHSIDSQQLCYSTVHCYFQNKAQDLSAKKKNDSLTFCKPCRTSLTQKLPKGKFSFDSKLFLYLGNGGQFFEDHMVVCTCQNEVIFVLDEAYIKC